MPVEVPEGVQVELKGSHARIKGPKGELERTFRTEMTIRMQENVLTVERPSDAPKMRALHGLTRSLLNNMVVGVSQGFEKNLEIVGVGYRVEKVGDNLVFRMGFSHTVEVSPIPGVALSAEAANRVKVSGIEKEVVGQMAAEIRAIRPPDAYKGKGIRYAGERVRLKPGKSKQAAK